MTVPLAQLQQQIDALAYPPTHQYDVATLTPRGPLVERLAAFDRVAPRFFDLLHLTFLDVGANKGFFSLLALHSGAARVTAIEPAPAYSHLLNDIGHQPFLAVAPLGLRDFHTTQRYDRVFIGNTHHYLFVEAGGWDFLAKLAAVTMSGAQVLIEGPSGMDCADMERVIPYALRSEFTTTAFLHAMSRWFYLCEHGPAARYTPDRHVWLFRRKASPIDDARCFADLQIRGIAHRAIRGVCYAVEGDLACKLYPPNLNTGYSLDVVALQLAAASPVSNGLTAMVMDAEHRLVGWLEPWIDVEPLRYFAQEEAVFNAYCRHQLFLTRNGYIDDDPGTINWAMVNGQPVLFDKNAVHPIAWPSAPGLVDRTAQCFRQSYRTIAPERIAAVLAGFKSRDAATLIEVFAQGAR